MTLEQIRLVQESWLKVLPVKEITAERFYGRLFQLDPSLRALFTRDMKEQSKKFLDMMDLVVGGLDRFEEDVVPVVRDLGARHSSYGVKPQHYQTLKLALLGVLEEVLGDAFAGETKQAWAATYDLLAQAMIELPSAPATGDADIKH